MVRADIRPITNDQEHALALGEIDRLWDSRTAAGVAALDALTILVAAYEAKRWPIEATLDAGLPARGGSGGRQAVTGIEDSGEGLMSGPADQDRTDIFADRAIPHSSSEPSSAHEASTPCSATPYQFSTQCFAQVP